MARKFLVLGEVRDGSLRNVSFEAIGAAKLAADGGEVVGVIFGEDVQAFRFTINPIWCRPCGCC